MALLYFDGCPSWQVAAERLGMALAEAGHDPGVLRLVRVESEDKAHCLSFTGSPTIRIDGVDPFATGDEAVAMSCRMYATPVGLAGSPTLDQFRRVLGTTNESSDHEGR